MAKKKKDAADFARRANATSRMGRHSSTTRVRQAADDVPAGMPAGEPAPTRPTPRPARGSNLAPTSTRDKPVPRPAGLAEQADLRKAMDSSDAALRASKREAADREMGMKAGGKVKKMAMGGKCRGMGAATKGGNYSRG